MDYIFDNERPIYVQLVEKIRLEIISGRLKSGERLPSVRELALTARVNPNTMQKALAELEDEGLVYTERTNGKFVTENVELIEKIKNELAKEKVNFAEIKASIKEFKDGKEESDSLSSWSEFKDLLTEISNKKGHKKSL